jgi:hypothetical protein
MAVRSALANCNQAGGVNHNPGWREVGPIPRSEGPGRQKARCKNFGRENQNPDFRGILLSASSWALPSEGGARSGNFPIAINSAMSAELLYLARLGLLFWKADSSSKGDLASQAILAIRSGQNPATPTVGNGRRN